MLYVFTTAVISYKLYQQTQKISVLNDALSKTQQEADTAKYEKTQFLSKINHEVRTPMNAILGFTELSLRAEEKQPNYLEKVYRSSQQLLALINNMLDLSKLESNQLKIDSVVFNLSLIVEELNHTATILAKNKHIKLNISPYTTQPELLKGDPLRLNQILTNLMSNAIKFTEQGEVSLKIKTQDQDLNKTSNSKPYLGLQFRIKDTGVGISKQQIKQLHQNYIQTDMNINQPHSGSGLSLTITKQLIEKMGGKIHVASPPGQGSLFHFTLEFLLPTQEEKTLYKDSDSSQPTLHYNKVEQNLTILLVEDNLVNQCLIQALLEDSGYTVDLAGNGLEAIEKLQKNKYNCILMDINMPVMDGLEATRQIRKQKQYTDLPIIALTANPLSGSKKECLAAGMDDYLTKPVDLQEFIDMLDKRINKVENITVNNTIAAYDLNSQSLSSHLRIQELYRLINEFDTRASDHLNELLEQENNTLISQQLLEISSYLKQYNYKHAKKLILKNLLKNQI